jgi:hypothetical protein
MPKKYEREIEEILRNMERSAPKPTLGQRIRRRPEGRSRGASRLPSFNFGFPEWCLLLAWAAALIAGGWAYAHVSFAGEDGTSLFTGVLAAFSVVCLLFVVLSSFLSRSRFPGRPSAGIGNVTPMRRNPLSSLRTRWNLFILKLRYRRRRDQ